MAAGGARITLLNGIKSPVAGVGKLSVTPLVQDVVMISNRPSDTAESPAAADPAVPQQLTLVPTTPRVTSPGPWRLSAATRRRGLQGVSAARAALEAARRRAAAEEEARKGARHAHAPRRCA